MKVKLKLFATHEEKRFRLHSTLFSLLCSVLQKKFPKLIPEHSILEVHITKFRPLRGKFIIPLYIFWTTCSLSPKEYFLVCHLIRCIFSQLNTQNLIMKKIYSVFFSFTICSQLNSFCNHGARDSLLLLFLHHIHHKKFHSGILPRQFSLLNANE